MSVRFILGRAGTGKTAWCFDRIVEALRADPLGPPIFLIVPKQATLQNERALACGSAIPGYLRVKVISFDELGHYVLDECGGTALPEVTAAGRQMILGHLLRKHQPGLEFFAAVAKQPGLAAEIDATFAELERSGADLLAIPQLLHDAHVDVEQDTGGANRALIAKLHDLQLLYAAYLDFLGQDRLDPNRRLQEALRCIGGCPSLKSAAVYVDAFHDFSDYERRLLAALGNACASVSITLPLDPDHPSIDDPHSNPDELNLFHRTSEAYRKLWFALADAEVTIDKPVFLRDVRRFRSPALARVEQWESSRRESTPAADGAVELIEAADRRGEVDAAARRIRDWVGQGLRLRDIAVLVRSSDDYHELIDASFAEHDVPYFVDRRRTAAHSPLVQFARAAFVAARNNCPHQAMMTLLKSGLVGLSDDEADEVENYVLLHGIRHGPWLSSDPWTGRKTTRDEDDDAVETADPLRVDALRRRMTGPLAAFVAKVIAEPRTTVRALAAALFGLLESFDVRATLAAWTEKAAAQLRLEQRGEHAQVWAETVKLFEQLVDLLGDELVSLDDFQAILDTGLESFDLALTPPTVDQVLVGQVDRTRTPPLKAVIVLGLNEGQFPSTSREGTVFSDLDRRTLRSRKVQIDPDTQRRLFDEAFLGYVAFTRASDRLRLIRATADAAGKPQSPSQFWLRVREFFPDLEVERVPRAADLAAPTIATPRQLVTSLMTWARSSPSPADEGTSNTWPALYQWLATHDRAPGFGGAAIDLMRERSWRALSYSNDAKLSPKLVVQLYRPPLKVRVPELESDRNCPFQHFARHTLRLRPREHREVTAQDLSHVYHDVMGKLLRELLKSSRDWAELTDEQARPKLRALTEEVGKALRGELMLSTARNQYLLERIEKTLGAVVAAQRETAGRGKFKPAWSDVRFEVGGQLPPLTVRTPHGQEVQVSGKIDRVDVLSDSAHAIVIDYKLGANALALPEVYHGLALQLLTYLLVLQEGGEKLAGRKLHPAAAFYVQMLRGISPTHPDEALAPDDPRFHLVVKPRGVFRADVAAALDDQQQAGWSEVVQAYVNKDGTFGHRDRTDVAEPDEFAALLRHVEKKIGQIAERVLSGDVSIQPYMLGKLTPCPRCEFRDVCRFDPAINRYAKLTVMRRDEVLRTMTGGGEATDGE